MLIDRFRQSAEDKLGYRIDMNRWLGDLEVIHSVQRIDTAVDVFLTDTLVVDPVDGKAFSFFASGGRPGIIVPVRFSVATSRNQRLTIEVEFAVNWPRGLPMLPPGTSPPPPTPPGGNNNLDAGQFTPGDNTGNCPI